VRDVLVDLVAVVTAHGGRELRQFGWIGHRNVLP